MTSQTLLDSDRPLLTADSVSEQASPMTDPRGAIAPSAPQAKIQTKKLPYQKPQQVELLSLHAEVEALLHQIQYAKQQRQLQPHA